MSDSWFGAPYAEAEADASTPAGALPSYSQIAATFDALADERSNS